MGKETKIEIKNRWSGRVIYEHSALDNTLKMTLAAAIRSDANLSDANLSGADLHDANLSCANLHDADLSDADLSGADLHDADLSGADLHDANLSDANLSGADLHDANLSGANLHDANLSGCVLDYNDNPNGYGDTSVLLNDIKREFGLDVTVAYENHDAFSCRGGAFWKNLVIIRLWRIAPSSEISIELTQCMAELLHAWLENSGYTDKRFMISKTGASTIDHVTVTVNVTCSTYAMYLRLPAGSKFNESILYRLDGNRIIEA